MSSWLHASLAFGIDYGRRPPRVVTAAGEALGLGDDSGGCTIGTPDDSEHRILYVTASFLPMLGRDGPLRAVTRVPREGDPGVSGYEATLRAFCASHALPWRAPGWFIAAEIG